MSEIAHSIDVTVTLKAITCGECGTAFGMSDRMYKERLNDHGTFYCPAGHPQHFIGQSEEAKLRQALRLETERKEWAQRQAKSMENRRRAAVGQLTKVKNRISKGVCPCCNRFFTKLHEHMKTQHKDYMKEKK